MLSLINAILGGALIVAGRKLFWLFVGAAGFVVGVQLTARFWQGRSETMAIIIGLVIGLIFAGLAIFLQTIAIGIAGFLAGGYVLSVLATMLGLDRGPVLWATYIIGGIIGVVMVGYLFDWALISLSSLAGASLIVQTFQLQRVADGVIFLVLVIIGVAIQSSTLRREKQPEQHES